MGERGTPTRPGVTRERPISTETVPVGLSEAERLDLALALDPVRLLELAGFTPTKFQQSFLRSTHPRRLVLAHRQAAKSTTAACLVAWALLFEPGTLALVVAQNLRAAAELLAKVLKFLRAYRGPVSTVAESKLAVHLGNGSRCVAIPGSEESCRGFSAPRIVLVDEAARVNPDVYGSLRPLFTSRPDGWLICLSTPTARGTWFFEEWESGGDEWERYVVRTDETPWATADFLERERAKLGESAFATEFGCEFAESEEERRNPRVFNAADIEKFFEP